MNSKIIAVLFLMIPVLSLFAQENNSKGNSDTIHNSLTKNKLAFQYETGFNFSGKTIIPIVFSFKYHLSDKTALRLSVGLNPSERGFDKRHMNDSLNNNEQFDNHGNNTERFDHHGNNIERLIFL